MGVVVEPIELGSVQLPTSHPRAALRTCPIRAFAVRHPDGVVLVDTGVADDHPLVNELYRPDVRAVVPALHAVGIDERDVVAIVNTHLHFDHCGQNRAFPSTPVWVQAAEHAMVEQPLYTVPDWARIPAGRLRLVDGDVELAPGLRLLATPGHTPGHQSVVVDRRADGDLAPSGPTIVVGQACYLCAEFAAGETLPADLHDPSWAAAGRESVARLRALAPAVAHFSHDAAVFRSPA